MLEDKSDFDRLLDEDQLAKRWGKSKHTVRKYRQAGKIAFVSVNGRVKYRMTEILRFEAHGDHPQKTNQKRW